jgi:outer membrane protein assembly factor BamB
MSKFCALVCLAFSCGIAFSSYAAAQVVNGVVSQQEAARHGLARAWYGQADLNGALGEIVAFSLFDGVLFVQTSRAQLQAIDAETGATRWSVTVGDERYPCLSPGASADFVATINGSTLYVIDRKTGREAWHKELPKLPGSGPALTDTHVFTPMVDGTIYGYELKKPDGIPFVYKSFGRILVQPVVTADSIGWTTERGYMYLMKHHPFDGHLAVNYRLETDNQIESRPGYWTPYLYSVSLDGYVFAVHEETGRIQWKFATAEPIIEPPVAVNGKVYVCKGDGGMFCLDGETGIEDWYAPSVTQFISVSPTRVYAADRLNRMLILDAKTGARIDSVPIGGVTIRLRNVQSDRIFLATGRGVVQCLHEAALSEPLKYTPPPLRKEVKLKTKQKSLKKDAGAADDAADEGADAPADAPAEKANPFGAGNKDDGAEEPKEKADDNPFG